MQNLNDGELFQLLKYVNNEGAKNKRIVGFNSGMSQSAGDGFWDDFIFIFDDGPTLPGDDPWPDTRISI